MINPVVYFFATPKVGSGLHTMQKTARTLIGSIILILIVVGIGAGIAWIKYRQIQAAMNAPPQPEMPIAVKFGVASPCTIRQSTNSVGTIMAPRSITIQTEVPGVVRKIGIFSGEIVEQGVPILELDSSVERAQLASVEARKKIANSTFRRLQLAADKNAISDLESNKPKRNRRIHRRDRSHSSDHRQENDPRAVLRSDRIY